MPVPSANNIVVGLPLDRILTETDGPFTKAGDHPAKPYDVAQTVSLLTGFLQISEELMRKQIKDLAALTPKLSAWMRPLAQQIT